MSEIEVTRSWLGDRRPNVHVGTMVIRAYAWHDIVPGIIIEEIIKEVITPDESDSYTEIQFMVQWSDGHLTRELYEELDTFLDNPYLQDNTNIVFKDYKEKEFKW